MTWTYSGAPDESTTAGRRDAVRLAIGDTDTSDQQVTDEAITYWLGLEDDDVSGAAIRALPALIAKYSRQADTSMGNTSVSASQRAKAYKDLLATLKSERGTRAEMSAGGLSISEKETYNSDSDAVQPGFSIDQDNYINPTNSGRSDLD